MAKLTAHLPKAAFHGTAQHDPKGRRLPQCAHCRLQSNFGCRSSSNGSVQRKSVRPEKREAEILLPRRQDTAQSLLRHIPRRTRDARISTLGSRSVRATGGGGVTRPVKLATAVRAERTEYSTVNTQSRGSSQYCPITAKLRAPCGRTSGRSPA